MTVVILVTHLLGTGHLARAAILARAFAAAGWRAVLVTGGRPAPHLMAGLGEVVQLPSLAADGMNFRRLLDESGAPANDALRAERIERTRAVLAETAPDVLITELFPFGRRQLADEFLAALECAKALPRPPRVFCSIRDILQKPSKPERAEEAGARLDAYYDGVLVHGDPALVRLEESWPVSPSVQAKLLYTGYVAPEEAEAAEIDVAPNEEGAGDVLVAAGGGPVGDALFEAAAQTARLTPGRRWRLLVGAGESQRAARIARLQALGAGAPLIVEPVRPDYRRLLRRACVSVSQIGYNTAIDLIQAGTPAVLAPFEQGGETEQRQRAEAFARRFGMVALPPGEIAPAQLAEAVEAAIARGAERPRGAIDLDGARRTAAIVAEAVAGRDKD